MRRKVILICLLLVITTALQAKVTYQPSLSFSSGGTFTCKVEDIIRSSYSFKAEIDPIAIQVQRRHTFSIPGYITYVSKTPYFQGYSLNDHLEFGAGISYRYSFNRTFSIRTIADMNIRYVYRVQGGIFSFGMTAEPWINFTDQVAMTFPLRIGFTKGEVSISPSIGITYVPLGDRR